MTVYSLRRVLALTALAGILSVLAAVIIPSSAGADPCYAQVSYVERLYEQPQSHDEYQFRQETFKTQHEVDKFTRERTRTEANQHYSYTGGKRSTFDPPAWPGDEGDWQANTHQEPHNGADDGLHWTGQWWNASWFYFDEGFSEWSDWSDPDRWEPTGSHLAWVDEVPAVNWQQHSYTDLTQRDWTVWPTGNTRQVSTGFLTSGWELNPVKDGWTLVDTKTVTDAPLSSGWTRDELTSPWVQIDQRDGVENGEQIPCDQQPPAEPRSDESSSTDCETGLVTTVTRTFERPFVLIGFEWVPGVEVLTAEASSQHAASPEECPLPPLTEPEFECDSNDDGVLDHSYNDPTDGICAEEAPPVEVVAPVAAAPVELVPAQPAAQTLPNTGSPYVWPAAVIAVGLFFIGGSCLVCNRMTRPV